MITDLFKIELIKRDNQLVLKSSKTKAPSVSGLKFIDTLKNSINREYNGLSADAELRLKETENSPEYIKKNNPNNSGNYIDRSSAKNGANDKNLNKSPVNNKEYKSEETELNKTEKNIPEEIDENKKAEDDDKPVLKKININELLKLNIADIKEIKEPAEKLSRLLENPEEIDFTELIRSIEQLLNALETISENKFEITFDKNSLKKLKEIFGKMNTKEKSAFFEKRFKNLKSLIDGFNQKALNSPEKDIKIKDLLAEINNTIKKLNKSNNKETISLKIIDSNKQSIRDGEGMNSLTKLLSDPSNIEKESMSNSFSGDSRDSDSDSGSYMNIFKHGKTGVNSKFDPGLISKNPKFRQQLRSIIDNSKVIIKDSRNGSFSVKLYPKELGRVNINIGMEDGVISGRFLVNNNEARELLLLNLSLIKNQLEEAGISVGEFNVNVNDQRETYNSDDNVPEGLISANGGLAEKAADYDRTSMALHDGAINYVI